ncbi:MAG: hypothetical protein AAGH19_01110 [Pseudomonadota bacterium]
MADKTSFIKPVAAIAGVAFVSSLAVSTTAAADNPFELSDLDAGYMLADGHGDKGEEGKCGEGKCGTDGEEGKCGEGKCGDDKGEEGKCGEGKCGDEKGEEGKCGEGKCGA